MRIKIEKENFSSKVKFTKKSKDTTKENLSLNINVIILGNKY